MQKFAIFRFIWAQRHDLSSHRRQMILQISFSLRIIRCWNSGILVIDLFKGSWERSILFPKIFCWIWNCREKSDPADENHEHCTEIRLIVTFIKIIITGRIFLCVDFIKVIERSLSRNTKLWIPKRTRRTF